MTRKRITDLDMVDFLLGDASEDLAECVAREMESDEKTAALYTQWSGILQAIGQEREAEKALQERATQFVMRRIREERLQADQSPSEASPLLGRKQWLSWKKACVGLAAAACLSLVVGLGVVVKTERGREPEFSDWPQFTSGAQTDSDTDVGSSPPRVRLGSIDSQVTQGPLPVDSLRAAISAVAPGGTVEIANTVVHGAVVIEKPVRLVALGGDVKIGIL